MRKNKSGRAVTRTELIEELARGDHKEAIALRIGYCDYNSINRYMRFEKITRHMLPCGVPVIIARK